MFRLKALLAAVVMVFGVMSAKADFIFSPNGNSGGAGSIANVTGFTYSPGNILSVGGTAAVTNFAAGGPAAGNNFTAYGQANFLATTGNVQSILPGTNAFTGVVGISERVVSLVGLPGAGSSASFALNPAGTVNYVEIYRNNALGNNLAGTGFNSAAAGDLIFRGVITALNTLSPVNTAASPTGALDQNGANNYTTNTLPLGGQIRVLGDILFADSRFFTANAGETFDKFSFDAQLSSPFLNVDPSARFLTGTTGTALGGVPAFAGAGIGAASLGTINGAAIGSGGGPDLQLQAVGNLSLTTRQIPTTNVPEPATMTLFGVMALGSGVVGVVRRRRTKVA